MTASMTMVKITVSLPEGLVAQAKAAVAAGRASSVSGYVAEAMFELGEFDADAYLDQMLAETGGPLTAEEIAWAAAQWQS
jgi:Arc/MetJ-type ribon-helix-helix transcriptional regulator